MEAAPSPTPTPAPASDAVSMASADIVKANAILTARQQHIYELTDQVVALKADLAMKAAEAAHASQVVQALTAELAKAAGAKVPEVAQ